MTGHPARYFLPLLAAASLLLTACSDGTPKPAEASTGSPSTGEPSSSGPTSLRDYEGSISPGRHRVPLIRWDRTYPIDALVDVPEGFITPGGWVIENGRNGTAYGDLMFFGDVDRVDTQPCGAGRLVKPGPTVQDLANALTAQLPLQQPAARPVTLHGHSGSYLEITAPRDLSTCDGGRYTLWTIKPTGAFPYEADQPGTVFRLWIIDVDGQRVVAAVKLVPGHTINAADFVRMAKTVEFVANVNG